MEGLELQCFQIISAVGTARSNYIEAINEAKEGRFEEARTLIDEGDESFGNGHSVHTEIVQREAGGSHVNLSLLLVHAEDLMISAETFKIMAQEFISNYKRIAELEAKVGV